MRESIQDRVGRAAHNAWKRWRIQNGYPDHLYKIRDVIPGMGFGEPQACECGRGYSQHHKDMIDWDELRPEKKEKYIVMGMAGRQARQGEVELTEREWKVVAGCMGIATGEVFDPAEFNECVLSVVAKLQAAEKEEPQP